MVKMEQEDESIRLLPLSFLPKSTKTIISDLLNPITVIPSDGPQKLHRDWRGLADLANIPSQVQVNIRNSPDQTSRVVDIWTQDPSVTVGNLLENLKLLDRWDVYDDLIKDLSEHLNKKDQRIVNIQNPATPHISADDEESEVLTYDDTPGYNHRYDAYVLYAEADQEFVNELKGYLDSQGFQICTKDKLLPGQATYPRLAKLISERCLRIILVYSPEFLTSSAEIFFRDYAQAISIDSRKNKIIPIMYRDCQLPTHLAVYHNLRYESGMYNFWTKLAHTLNISRMPRIVAGSSPVAPRIQISQAHSAVKIEEVSSSNQSLLNVEEHLQRSVSEETITSRDASSNTSDTSDTSEVKKKKSSKMKSLFKFRLPGKKYKKREEMCNGS